MHDHDSRPQTAPHAPSRSAGGRFTVSPPPPQYRSHLARRFPLLLLAAALIALAAFSARVDAQDPSPEPEIALVARGSVNDSSSTDDVRLRGARYVKTFTQDGKTYAATAANTAPEGPSLLDVTDPMNIGGQLEPISGSTTGGATAIDPYIGIDGNLYFAVTWYLDDAVQTFNANSDDELSGLTYVIDGIWMNGAEDVFVYTVVHQAGSWNRPANVRQYAVVIGSLSNSIRIVDVTDPRGLGDSFNDRNRVLRGIIADTGSRLLNRPTSIAYYPRGNRHYAVVTSSGDNGVQIVDVTNPHGITAAGNLADTNDLLLDGARHSDIYTVGDRTYAVVASHDDSGIQIIDITDPNNITPAGKLQDTGSLRLGGASGVAVHTIGDRQYAVVASVNEDGVQVIDVTDPHRPVAKANIGDTGSTELDGARDVDTFSIGNRHYAVVAAEADDGVQIVELVVVQADAGPDQTTSTGTTVTLDGSRSVVSSGATPGYTWSQTGGPSVTLQGSATASPTFTAPSTSGDLTFRLAILHAGVTSTDTVTIKARAPSGTYTGHGGTTTSPSLGVQTVNKVGGGSAQYLSMHFSGEDESRTFSYRLAAQPSGTITVDFMTMVQSAGYGRPGYTWDSQAVSVSPRTLTFTTSNWSTPQTVNIVSQTDEDSRSEQVMIAIVTSIPRAQGDPYGHAGIHVTVDDTQSRRSSPGTEAELGRLKRTEETQAQPEQQVLANNPPTVAAPLADLIEPAIGGGQEIDLSGVFADADGDALTYSTSTTNEDISVGYIDGSRMLVLALGRGTATITVTADDGNGGTVSDAFTVTVKEAPTVASPIADISSLEAGASRQVSLSDVFADADGDALTVSAASSDSAVATAAVGSGSLTVAAQQAGTATITVTARDSDGNQVSDAFSVTVIARPEPEPQVEAPASEPEQAQQEESGSTPDSDLPVIVLEYDKDGSGKIEQDEWALAIADYVALKLTTPQIQVIAGYRG